MAPQAALGLASPFLLPSAATGVEVQPLVGAEVGVSRDGRQHPRPLPLALPNSSDGRVPPGPVGGRLSRFLDQWLPFVSSSALLRVVAEGYRIPFWERPPLRRTPPFSWCVVQRSQEELLGQVLQDLRQKEAIEEVHAPHSPGFYSTIFLIPKPNGTVRKITNLKALNRVIVNYHFRMETPQSVLAAMQVGQWDLSVDLKDAYFHIAVHPHDRKYLCLWHWIGCGSIERFASG